MKSPTVLGVLVTLALLAIPGSLALEDEIALPQCRGSRDEEPAEYTCLEQVKWGKCNETWVIEGNYCEEACGRCEGRAAVPTSGPLETRARSALEEPPSSACLSGYGPPETALYVKGGLLEEESGIAASRANEGILWLHNDNYDKKHVIAVSVLGPNAGNIVYVLDLEGLPGINRYSDFEDIRYRSSFSSFLSLSLSLTLSLSLFPLSGRGGYPSSQCGTLPVPERQARGGEDVVRLGGGRWQQRGVGQRDLHVRRRGADPGVVDPHLPNRPHPSPSNQSHHPAPGLRGVRLLQGAQRGGHCRGPGRLSVLGVQEDDEPRGRGASGGVGEPHAHGPIGSPRGRLQNDRELVLELRPLGPPQPVPDLPKVRAGDTGGRPARVLRALQGLGENGRLGAPAPAEDRVDAQPLGPQGQEEHLRRGSEP